MVDPHLHKTLFHGQGDKPLHARPGQLKLDGNFLLRVARDVVQPGCPRRQVQLVVWFGHCGYRFSIPAIKQAAKVNEKIL
ncbi:MAG: hypothetical protein R3F37_14265 [Candidatus Competibacteraceae bacterium]